MGEDVSRNVVNMLRIEPLSAGHAKAIRAFNERMRGSGDAAVFDLPETTAPESEAARLIRATHFVVADEEEVRGGILAVDVPAWVAGAEREVSNYQSPLSEGIVDRRYASIGPMLIRFAQKRSPLAYMVGMGSETSPLARLLSAARWSIGSAPFQFRVHSARRTLKELRVAHATSFRSMFAAIAGGSGAAAVGFAFLQRPKTGIGGFSARIEKCWGDWADEIWEAFRCHCTFAMRRDRAALEELFPAHDSRNIIIRIEREGETRGWAACYDTQMRDHPHFGNLRVGAILDCLAQPDSMAETAALADRELATLGAHLVLTNQTHRLWVDAFRRAGFLSGPSNYVVALSPALATACAGRESIHVTRADGDGRIHL